MLNDGIVFYTVLIFLGAIVTNVQSDKKTDVLAITNCGPVEGVEEDGAFSFRGIPYAQPPVGSLRWKPPVALGTTDGTCWKGTFKANTFGSPCFQSNILRKKGEPKYLGSEDCLYLNVWTPNLHTTANLPVVVWIHGGSLIACNGNWPTYSPTEKLARETNMVYVSMNYRLHAFGFMALQMLADDSATKTSGNYGLMDVIKVLEWVKINIRAFGGDPGKVTVVGQSSGGTLVFALLASPLCSGLFHRAWMQSASPVLNTKAETAYKDNEAFLRKTRCADLKCIYSLTPKQVIESVPWDDYPRWGMPDMQDLPTEGIFNGAMLIVDGLSLTESPFEAWKKGIGVDVPVVVGTTANEIDDMPKATDVNKWSWDDYKEYITLKIGTFGDSILAEAFRYYPPYVRTPEYQLTSMASDIHTNCGNDVMASVAAKTFTSSVYRYVITAEPSKPVYPMNMSFPASYAFHLLDSYAFFGTLSDYIDPLAEADIQFQNNIRTEMLSFIRNGKPYNIRWKEFPRTTALLSENTETVKRFHERQCNFWLKHGFFEYSWINR